MASDLEDDEDLASLRSAALASLNVRSAQASPLTDKNLEEENNKQDEEEDEEEDLEALRLAALKTKKAVVPQPVTPQPRGPSPLPYSQASINSVRGNNLISIPLLDLSAQDTSSKEAVVPEVKKEVRNDKFSRFQSDSESEEEEEEDIESEPENEISESSANDADASDISDDASVDQSGKDEESDNNSGEDGSAASCETESEAEKSSETESSTSSSESEEDSSSEGSESDQESSKEVNEEKETSDQKNGTMKPQTENIKLKTTDPPCDVNKTKIIDLRNQLRKKQSETRDDRVERKDRYKTDRVADQDSSRDYSRSYVQQNRSSHRQPNKYQSDRDRKGNNVERDLKHRHNYDRPPRKSDEFRKRDNYSSDNKREKDRSALSSKDHNRILDRRKSDKRKEKSQAKSDTLKKNYRIQEQKNLTSTEDLSLSDSDSDIDTDSRFKQAKSERTGEQIDNAPSRIVTSMQFNRNFEPNFARKRDFQRDRSKDQDLRNAPRFDRKIGSHRIENYRKDQYMKDEKPSWQKKHDLRENHASSSRERSHGRDPVRSRELKFVDDSDEDKHKKGIRSFVHKNNTKKDKKENGPVEKRHKDGEQRRKREEKERKYPSSKERTETSRSKEKRTGKANSSIKLLKKVKLLDVGDESKTTEVSVTFDSDPEKVLKRSKKSIQERLGKTVSKHKAPVKLRLGPKDDLQADAWNGVENFSRGSKNSSQQDARKFVSKGVGKSRKSVKERLNLKRTPNEIDIDTTLEPSRKIVRSSRTSSAVDKMSEEEKLKRRKREKEIQEKIRKIEERNLASSKGPTKENDIDLPVDSNNKDKELELRIRRIKEKNEAILKRQREIEEDKQKYGK